MKVSMYGQRYCRLRVRVCGYSVNNAAIIARVLFKVSRYGEDGLGSDGEENILSDLLTIVMQELGHFSRFINVAGCEGVDKNRSGVFLVGDCRASRIGRLADGCTSLIVAPDGDMNTIINFPWNGFKAVGGYCSKGNDLMTYPAEIRYKRRFGPGQDGKGYAPLLFRLEKPAPRILVAVFSGELLFTGEIITPFTTDVELLLMSYVDSRRKKNLRTFSQRSLINRIGDDFRKFVTPVRCGHLFFYVELIDDVLGNDAHSGELCSHPRQS